MNIQPCIHKDNQAKKKTLNIGPTDARRMQKRKGKNKTMETVADRHLILRAVDTL